MFLQVALHSLQGKRVYGKETCYLNCQIVYNSTYICIGFSLALYPGHVLYMFGELQKPYTLGNLRYNTLEMIISIDIVHMLVLAHTPALQNLK